MSSEPTISLRWNNYSSYIVDAFESLRHEEHLVDVTLNCEGRQIRAHKLLLSAYSKYFKDIFKENPCQHPIIIFKNGKYLDLVLLVQFMYQGEVNVRQECLSSFLQTADMLAIRGLSEAPVKEQVTTALTQRAIETQSRNENSATNTVDLDYFESPITTTSHQFNMEPQPPGSPVFFTNTLLKSANDQSACDLDKQIMTHVPQQQQPNCTLQLLKKPTCSYAGNELESPSMISMPPAKEHPGEINQSSVARQELGGSVIFTERRVQTARLYTPLDFDEAPGNQETNSNMNPSASYATLETIFPAASINQAPKMYGTASENQDEEPVNFSKSICAAKSLAMDSGSSGTFAESPDFEMMCEATTNLSESRPTLEQSNSFKMTIVDITMESVLNDEKDAPKESAKDYTVKTKAERFKCLLCSKRFATRKSLVFHKDFHTGRTQCSICDVVLSRIANLKRHRKLLHSS